MKNLSLILLGFTILFSCCSFENKENKISSPKTLVFNFDNQELGGLPKSWSQNFTGEGNHTEWKLVNDNGNKVLAQVSDKQPNYHFNIAVYNDFITKNVALKVNLKAVAGKLDQGGGLVWRYTDADNYYVVRANPLEDNVVLYKVVNGIRTDLPILGKGKTYGMDVPKLGNDWFSLSVKVADDLFTVYLNGKELFRVQDQSITKAGKVGLWTKADAVTYFDELRIN